MLSITYRNLIKTVALQRELRARIVWSVSWLTTGWTVWGSKSNGGRFSAPAKTSPSADPASYLMGTRSLSQWYSSWVMVLATQPHLASRVKKGKGYTFTPFLYLHSMLQDVLYLLHFIDGTTKWNILPQHEINANYFIIYFHIFTDSPTSILMSGGCT
jgi:hypothetical protein